MRWRERAMQDAYATIQENDLELAKQKRMEHAPYISEIAWSMLQRNDGTLFSCYPDRRSTTPSCDGVDLTRADRNGNLWMSYRVQQIGFAIHPGMTAYLVQILRYEANQHGITWNVLLHGEGALLNPVTGSLSEADVVTLYRAFVDSFFRGF